MISKGAPRRNLMLISSYCALSIYYILRDQVLISEFEVTDIQQRSLYESSYTNNESVTFKEHASPDIRQNEKRLIS